MELSKLETIQEVETITGAKVVAITKETCSFNTDFVLLSNNGRISQAFITRGINGKMFVDLCPGDYSSAVDALSYLNMSETELKENIDFITPENDTAMNETKTTVKALRGSAKEIRQWAADFMEMSKEGKGKSLNDYIAAGCGEVANVDAIELQNVYGYTYGQALKALTDAEIFRNNCVFGAVLLVALAVVVLKFRNNK